MSVLSREAAAERVLWSLGLRGKPHQVRILLYLLGRVGVFTAPELVRECGVTRGLVYPFLACLRRMEVVFGLPRPMEPPEWVEVYGRGVLRRKRRELHVTGAAPLAVNVGRLRALVSASCSEPEVTGILGEVGV